MKDEKMVHISIDFSQPEMKSNLNLGVTLTHCSLDNYGHPKANNNVNKLLSNASRWTNVHIHQWGVECPQPKKGIWDWTSLDRRMELVSTLCGDTVITLCAAPDWMKGPYNPEQEKKYMDHGQTWWWLEKAPLPEYYNDFAEMAVEVAKRYPYVKHFQLWNEMKGFVHSSRNEDFDDHNHIYYEEYTDFYNYVYDALKAFNPSLQVGGYYAVIQGTGSEKGGVYTEKPIRSYEKEAMLYWLQNMHGADFICLDRGVKSYWDKTNYTQDECMDLTEHFYHICEQIREFTTLPIWWSEYYPTGMPGSEGLAANLACVHYYMIKGGSSVALLWNPIDNEGLVNYLFTDTKNEDGGQPVPSYQVFKMFNEYFGDGTLIYSVECSKPKDILVIASEKKILLINKRSRSVQIQLQGKNMVLEGLQILCLNSESFANECNLNS